MGDLSLQVGDLYSVVVSDDEMANPRCSQIHGSGAPQPAHADDENCCVQQGLLSRNIHFGKHDLAAVAKEFLVLHVLVSVCDVLWVLAILFKRSAMWERACPRTCCSVLQNSRPAP